MVLCIKKDALVHNSVNISLDCVPPHLILIAACTLILVWAVHAQELVLYQHSDRVLLLHPLLPYLLGNVQDAIQPLSILGYLNQAVHWAQLALTTIRSVMEIHQMAKFAMEHASPPPLQQPL